MWKKASAWIERPPEAGHRECCGMLGRDPIGAGTENHGNKELFEVLGRGDPLMFSEQRNDMGSRGNEAREITGDRAEEGMRDHAEVDLRYDTFSTVSWHLEMYKQHNVHVAFPASLTSSFKLTLFFLS